MEGGGGSAWQRRDALAGLTLGAVLGNDKEHRPQQVNRTLLDIIRDEELNSRAYKNLIDHHHKKSWKSFKDRLRLKRAGAAWSSSVPAFDVPFHHNASNRNVHNAVAGGEENHRPQFGQLLRHHSVRVVNVDVEEPDHDDHHHRYDEVPPLAGGDGSGQQTEGRVHMLNRSLSRMVSLQSDLTQEDTLHIEQVPVSDVPAVQNNRILLMRRDSSRIPASGQPHEPVHSVRLSEALAAEREQIQLVVSSTEAAGRRAREEQEQESRQLDNEREEGREEERGEEGGGGDDGQQQVRMSLMDLLEETDRQMGWSSYTGDGDDDDEDDEEGEEEVEGVNLVERNCCVCMVRHKGSAFIPCGHTFCRLCSRELWVNRGNCPLCNGFILEILDIF